MSKINVVLVLVVCILLVFTPISGGILSLTFRRFSLDPYCQQEMHRVDSRTVLLGERFISPEISRRLINQALGASDVTKTPIEQLTDRELEIFSMIGEGLTTGAIVNRLLLSTHTIDTHRENIKRKLAIKTAAELSRAAVQWLLEKA